jgi:predicted dienelactone hydrolase
MSISVLPLIVLGVIACATTFGHAGQPPAPGAQWSAQGPYAVQATDQTWRDSTRDRDIPVRIYAPVGVAGKTPVVLFSHGMGGNRMDGEHWGRQWASWGIVSVHIQHAGTDTDAVRNATGPILLREKNGVTPQHLIDRAQDASFAASEIARRASAGDPLFSSVDPVRLGMSGHSYGAQTAQALAGQREPSVVQPLADKRFRAFIAFSPADRDLGGSSLFSGITAPFLSVTGSQDQVGVDPLVTPEVRRVPFMGMAPGNKYFLWLNKATHMSFEGKTADTFQAKLFTRLVDGNATPPDQAHIDDVVKGVTTAFWLAYLAPETDLGKSAAAWLKSGGPKSLFVNGDRWEAR